MVFNKSKSGYTTAVFVVLVAFLVSLLISDLFRVRATVASELGLPEPTALLSVSKQTHQAILKGIRFDPKNPMIISFIIDKGDKQKLKTEEIENFIEYFLAGLSFPDSEFWVNLSPYEENRIISDSLLGTQIARQLLSQDYVLKLLSSSLTHPKTSTGASYWKEQELNEGALLNFDKVWISSDKASVYELENKNAVLINEASLTVQTEADYFAHSNAEGQSTSKANDNHAMAGILDELSKEVNEGEHFTQLRQVYNALILSKWVKENIFQILENSTSFIHGYSNSSKIKGLDTSDPKIKDQIYSLYVESVKKGSYDFVSKDKHADEKAVKKYFSGGLEAMPKSVSSAVISQEQMDEMIAYLPQARVEFETIKSDEADYGNNFGSLAERVLESEASSDFKEVDKQLRRRKIVNEHYIKRNSVLGQEIYASRNEYREELLKLPMMRQWLINEVMNYLSKHVKDYKKKDTRPAKKERIETYREFNKLLRKKNTDFKAFVEENKLGLLVEKAANRGIAKISRSIEFNHEFADEERQKTLKGSVLEFMGKDVPIEEAIKIIEKLKKIRNSSELRAPINKFILKNERLIKFMVDLVRPRYQSIDSEELKSLCYFSAVESIENWDSSQSSFSSHYYRYILKNYLLHVQKNRLIHMPNTQVQNAKKMREVYIKYSTGEVERSAWEEVCEELEMLEYDALALIVMHEGGYDTLIETVDDNFEPTDEAAIVRSEREKVRFVVKNLKETRDRELFEAFLELNNGKAEFSLTQAAFEIGLNNNAKMAAVWNVDRLLASHKVYSSEVSRILYQLFDHEQYFDFVDENPELFQLLKNQSKTDDQNFEIASSTLQNESQSKKLGGIDLSLSSVENSSAGTVSLKQFISGYRSEGVNYKILSIS